MPTYQYACTSCDERLEVVQKFSDDPLTVCTACGGRLRKLFSAVGIVFKGSGFYRTDSRNGPVPAQGKNGRQNGSEPAAQSGSGSAPGEQASPAQPASSGEGTSSGDAKPAKKDTAGSGGSSVGAKVA